MRLEDKMAKELMDMIDIKLLEPKTVSFFGSKGGFVGVKCNGEEYGRIILARTMPYTNPFAYISVMTKEQEEIGIIKDVDELDEKSCEIIKAELERRYFCNSILSIISAKSKMGYLYMEVDLDKGRKTFAVSDVTKNIQMLDFDGKILVTDVDGNRYYIENLDKLDKKGQKLLMPYIF